MHAASLDTDDAGDADEASKTEEADCETYETELQDMQRGGCR